jgi:hypothetical protein
MFRLLSQIATKVETQGPQVVITPTIYSKMQLWTHQAAAKGLEVSGVGTATLRNGVIKVNRIFLVKASTVGPGDVEMDPRDLGRVMKACIVNKWGAGNIRLLWHSHVRMSVFWSGQDEKACKVFGDNSLWTVNIVTNVHGHFLARQDFPKTKAKPLINIPLGLDLSVPKRNEVLWSNEYADKLSQTLQTVST